MRTLKFAPGSKAFEMLHEASLNARPPQGAGAAWHKIATDIQRTFEKVGTPLNSPTALEAAKKMGMRPEAINVYGCPKGAVLTFEEGPFVQLREMLDSFAGTVGAFAAKQVGGAAELLDATEKEEPNAKPARKRSR